MSKIVFRGKRMDIGTWVYGSLIIYSDRCEIRTMVNDDSEDLPGYNDVYPETIGQYTGMKDIKGEHIWEGDIVQYNCSDKVIIGKVAWCSSFFEVDVKNGAESYALTSFCRVIGNIHDNPERLEGVKA